MVGDLTPTRDFNYVTDTCHGFIEIAKTPGLAGEEINIATQREVSMETTLKTIAKLMDADIKWVTDPERLRPAGSEVFRLLGSNEKITTLTGWRPQVSLEEGLRRTIDWITSGDNLKNYKPNIYNK